jgi:hypothetical protein
MLLQPQSQSRAEVLGEACPATRDGAGGARQRGTRGLNTGAIPIPLKIPVSAAICLDSDLVRWLIVKLAKVSLVARENDTCASRIKNRRSGAGTNATGAMQWAQAGLAAQGHHHDRSRGPGRPREIVSLLVRWVRDADRLMR